MTLVAVCLMSAEGNPGKLARICVNPTISHTALSDMIRVSECRRGYGTNEAVLTSPYSHLLPPSRSIALH